MRFPIVSGGVAAGGAAKLAIGCLNNTEHV